ncbi:ARPP-1 family domain-containing protein [Actinomadura sp. 6N118]|uniref:ARPP-1 family domain-containing protein n=1 Tax=Actinomadura sp. 6N118 TaxID=3375151 RepID=UPI0037A82097
MTTTDMPGTPGSLEPLVPGPVDLTGYRLGAPQQAGALTMIPITGPAYPGIVPPRSGLKLTQVAGYGRVELRNGSPDGVAIVPLHIGYIQDAAQNHALCRSAFLAPGAAVMFDDACCVQESQGGYLTERDQWFFVLPVELRARALELRGVHGYSKLWNDIGNLNARYGLPRRGHLEQVLSRKRAVLTQFQSRLEPQPGQLGALFFIGGRFAGLELAPDPVYFAEVWMALVCFAYGAAAWHAEPQPAPGDLTPAPYEAADLASLRAELARDRAARTSEIAGWAAAVPAGDARLQEEERYLGLRLSTVTGAELAGQVVTDGDRPVYASLFARSIT